MYDLSKEKSTVHGCVVESSIAADILNIDQTWLQFQYLLECLYRPFPRSMMQHIAPVSISCSAIDIQLLGRWRSEKVLNNMRVIVNCCEMKDVIIFIS